MGIRASRSHWHRLPDAAGYDVDRTRTGDRGFLAVNDARLLLHGDTGTSQRSRWCRCQPSGSTAIGCSSQQHCSTWNTEPLRMTSQPEVSRCCSNPERPRRALIASLPRLLGGEASRLGKRPRRNCRAHDPIRPATERRARARSCWRVRASRPSRGHEAWRQLEFGAHQLAARASAIPTPTAESPPTTEASHTTSRASARTDFHIGGLPPSRGHSTARASHWFLALAPYPRNFAWYGTAHKPSSLSSNPRAQTTDVLAVGPILARVSDGATPAPGLDRSDRLANLPSKAGVAEPSSTMRGYAAGGDK